MKRGVKTADRNSGLKLGVFTEADLDDLHLASLEVLDRVGVFVECEEPIGIFADGGCRVNRETRNVRIPPQLVSDALQSVRPSFRICGRDPEHDVLLEPGRVTHAPFGEGIVTNDLRTGERRPTVKDDIADIACITDALDEIDIAAGAVAPRDVPPETAALHGLEAALPNTTKPICVSGMSGEEVELAFRIASVVAGGEENFRERPFVFLGACPVSPMILGEAVTSAAIVHARWGVPFQCISMGMAGASTPIAGAATLVVQNVEQLATLVLTQLVNRGNGFWYGTSACMTDMRWGSVAVGAPESAALTTGTAAMARYYNIPSWTAGY